MFKMWYIVKREDHPCNELDNKEKKGYTTCIIPDLILVCRHKFLFSEILYFLYIISFFNPVLKPLAVQPLSPF